MRTAFILTAILFVPAVSFSDTIIVPDDYNTIQAAIDAAVNGDTVLVKPGTYKEKIDFKGKAITVMSEQGADVTVIDGNQSGSVVRCGAGEGPDSVLDGFSITNGKTYGDGGGMYNFQSNPTVKYCTFTGNTANSKGGGMCNYWGSNPLVTNCTFTENSADYGGGMSNTEGSSPTVTGCIFSQNAGLRGIGMWNSGQSNPMVTHCTFTGNSTNIYGGGMYNDISNPTVANCTFYGNAADGGGGMFNFGCNPMITNCSFSGNSADYGGGMDNYQSEPMVTNCTFTGNSANNRGGGMYNYDCNPMVTNCSFSGNSADYGGGMDNFWSGSPTVTSCTFTENSAGDGGGMGNWHSNSTVTNCTFSGNSAGTGAGMYNIGSDSTVTNCTFNANSAWSGGGGMRNSAGSNPLVTNCILWNDTPYEIYIDNSNTTLTYSCVQGGWPGTGNIDSDPLFVDPAQLDCHLTYLSPCKDTGDNAALSLPTEDFEGDPRIAYGTVDMGADEFYTHLYYTGDTVIGGYIELKFVALPHSSPICFWIALNAMDIPYSGTNGDWYLLPPYIGPFSLGAIPSNGVYVLPGTIPSLPPAPYTMYMQALLGGTPMKLTNLCTMDVK